MSMQKKLEAARREGYEAGFEAGLKASASQKEIQKSFLDGIKVGADAANEAWSSAVRNAPGVGPKTIKKIYDQADKEHQERKVERELLAKSSEAKGA
ncbi:hypothetical protein TCA2_5985 [Paenibacillus sp. TCA20]|uniref:hypothetical protein n=1 Tax=Paenibacillus sp. TCA20 TaxID=1499968 RepID=UPI0004D71DF4|nr:hypothetical protein [Paenibacillus sp. TCA20]GAK43487.1 hypothetical protein TCA2_5985 [Paenibacillus sp. TCA20]